MTREELIERVNKFQGANREFSQELPPIVEALCDEIDAAGPEVVDSLTSNSKTKALSANQGKNLKQMVDSKVEAPEVAGSDGQVLSLQSGEPAWVDAPEGTVIIDSAMSDSSTHAVQNKVITEELDKCAKKDGSYDALTVGMAKNIEGKNSLEGTFLFRPTAGDADVASGVAIVEKVKGNAVEFNQLVQNGDFSNGTTGWTASGGTLSVSGGVLSWTGGAALYQTKSDFVVGHKYLSIICIKISEAFHLGAGSNTSVDQTATGDSFAIRTAITTATAASETFYITTPGAPTVEVKSWMCFDLTLMLDAGNEPSSVALFEAWLAANVGNKPYFPATQKLLPTKLLGLKMRGFNQWDEQWLSGYYQPDGTYIESDSRICSKNMIKVKGGIDYYIRAPKAMTIFFFDEGLNNLGGAISTQNAVFQTPANCAYILFYCTNTDYGNVYANDICINLSWDGSRDGEYEPAEIHEYNLDVTKFYGKLNGEGDLVQIFPNGMKKADYAGTIRDLLDLVNAEADVKVGGVDLGDYTYMAMALSSGGHAFTTTPGDDIPGAGGWSGYDSAPCICSKYAASAQAGEERMADKSIAVNQWTGNIGSVNIIDTSYSNADAAGLAAFKASLAGVKLCYPLATPLHYTDLVYRDNGVDTPVEALNILVNNWGTEEEIVAAPEASGEPNSCAATLDILYGIDAAEQLDTINQSGILTESLKANLEALIGVLNTNCSEALGGTIAISDNPTDKVYSFTFTPNGE